MDNQDSAAVPPAEPPVKRKKPYRSPALVAHGEVRTLTQAQTMGSTEMNPTGNPPFMT